jgi:hypothetical protein
MTWVESVSPSFRARHDAADAAAAESVLYTLEDARAQLERLFARAPSELTVVLHQNAIGLSMTNPMLPLAWIATAPSARRYVAGWAGRHELHMLSPAGLEARASGVEGSREMLLLTPAALYAKRVIAENNRELIQARTVPRLGLEFRWAWLLEGGARWFAGQTDHARAAIARRLREGDRPRFPPGPRDAALLGGTVVDLLARELGEGAAVKFVSRLPAGGSRAWLKAAFGRSPTHTEGAWRSHLAQLASAG